jgi:hypothetical protein
MQKKLEVTQEPAEFPLTLEEFLTEIPDARVETKAGFLQVMRAEQIGGAKHRQEWKQLLELYQTQPASMAWTDWTKSQANEGGN